MKNTRSQLETIAWCSIWIWYISGKIGADAAFEHGIAQRLVQAFVLPGGVLQQRQTVKAG
ncbi:MULTISPECIES: hypothetical protein [Stenotrophomonas]|uniref:hypothetical protein n=1 Tax=Stenotrophomonas TaxID=40323 RepID=UPI000F848002|nr:MULTISPECIES: hypothetical protein [Stenotrophomonas]RTY11543.1 hypothetical protein EKT70_09825 [Stenotrophomonas geniculata]